MSHDGAEPLHLRLSADKSSESVDRLLLERFKKLSRFPEAFSSIQYWGTQTLSPPTDFCGLQNKLDQLLDNNATRSPRTPAVIFKALQVRVKGAVSLPPRICTCMSVPVRGLSGELCHGSVLPFSCCA